MLREKCFRLKGQHLFVVAFALHLRGIDASQSKGETIPEEAGEGRNADGAGVAVITPMNSSRAYRGRRVWIGGEDLVRGTHKCGQHDDASYTGGTLSSTWAVVKDAYHVLPRSCFCRIFFESTMRQSKNVARH